MNKNKIKFGVFIGLMLVLGIILFGIFRQKKVSSPLATAAKTQSLYSVVSGPLPTPVKTDFSRLQQKKSQETKAPIAKEVPKWCQAQWDQLISLGTGQFIKNLEQIDNHDFPNCLDFLPAAAGIKAFLQQTCEQKDGRYVFKGTCISSVLFYRALLIDLNTLDDVNFSKMTLQILLNKILGRMLQGEDVYKKSRDQMQAMAHEIKNLEPNNPSTYKILSVVEMMTNPDGDILPMVQEGLKLDPKDVNLRELWFYSQIQNKNFDMLAYAKANPQDDMATYYYASELWKTDHMDLARNLAQQLAQQYPDNKKYQKTLENLKTASQKSDQPFFIEIPIILETW